MVLNIIMIYGFWPEISMMMKDKFLDLHKAKIQIQKNVAIKNLMIIMNGTRTYSIQKKKWRKESFIIIRTKE